MVARVKKVIVHPLVLLSVADHYERSGKVAKKRVVGTLLGSIDKDGVVEVTNCFGVLFEEDRKDESIWFLDRQFHEKMHEMFIKVNSKEKVVGWYSSEQKIKKVDLKISKLYKNYCPDPVLVVVNTMDEKANASSKAYSLEELGDSDVNYSGQRLTFNHLPTLIKATGPEEIGIEHLLRDVRDKTELTIEQIIKEKEKSVETLQDKVSMIEQYLDCVMKEKLPRNDGILYHIQEILNHIFFIKKLESFYPAYVEKNNENHLNLYLTSLSQAVLSLVELVENREGQKELVQQKRDERIRKENEAKKREMLEKGEEQKKADSAKKDDDPAQGKDDNDDNKMKDDETKS